MLCFSRLARLTSQYYLLIKSLYNLTYSIVAIINDDYKLHIYSQDCPWNKKYMFDAGLQLNLRLSFPALEGHE